jgi:hypothetical protein
MDPTVRQLTLLGLPPPDPTDFMIQKGRNACGRLGAADDARPDRLIGVGKGYPSPLRTARAVFPHTALQSVVVLHRECLAVCQAV